MKDFLIYWFISIAEAADEHKPFSAMWRLIVSFIVFVSLTILGMFAFALCFKFIPYFSFILGLFILFLVLNTIYKVYKEFKKENANH